MLGPIYYDWIFNPKDFKTGEHAGNKSVVEHPNLRTAQNPSETNDDWNKSVNDRQTHTFDKGLAASQDR